MSGTALPFGPELEARFRSAAQTVTENRHPHAQALAEMVATSLGRGKGHAPVISRQLSNTLVVHPVGRYTPFYMYIAEICQAAGLKAELHGVSLHISSL